MFILYRYYALRNTYFVTFTFWPHLWFWNNVPTYTRIVEYKAGVDIIIHCNRSTNYDNNEKYMKCDNQRRINNVLVIEYDEI